ncbi:NAD(P)H-dependent oxidoreductase [Chelatococcus sp. SYSU_G07232]|uniref:NAD(P)H-dependent oxidoreductase n=1 Tax=Chelatococcus albus TaxID=3047466 RepID=A0ABT7AG70_9HYPH|nr:NAD(P)H-dependent oxidoreductase [Chelatococcus sp. SYSU_G07232]MDJ1158370.1 NAD(P)H-dependent oxidoreductase [Chelatococcus sp. SYSU_G07232]
MRVLLVYCHPCPESFIAAVRDRAIAALKRGGHDVRLLDLYAEGFDPVMSAEERRHYHTPGRNEAPVAAHLAHLRWAEALVFIYPTWWYGLPAMLKGWLDRVWVPHATFEMPKPGRPIARRMKHIRVVAAISTLGSPRWWWWLIGMPGRRTLLTGISVLCHWRCRRLWMALHRMDSTTDVERNRFLAAVERRLSRI